MNPNRAVVVLTPLIFAPAAGAISAFAAKYGLQLDGGELSAVFVTGATIAFAKAGLWLKGWQDFEKHELAARDAPVMDEPFAPGRSEDITGSGFDAEVDLDEEFEFDIDDDDAMDELEVQFAAPGQ